MFRFGARIRDDPLEICGEDNALRLAGFILFVFLRVVGHSPNLDSVREREVNGSPRLGSFWYRFHFDPFYDPKLFQARSVATVGMDAHLR